MIRIPSTPRMRVVRVKPGCRGEAANPGQLVITFEPTTWAIDVAFLYKLS